MKNLPYFSTPWFFSHLVIYTLYFSRLNKVLIWQYFISLKQVETLTIWRTCDWTCTSRESTLYFKFHLRFVIKAFSVHFACHYCWSDILRSSTQFEQKLTRHNKCHVFLLPFQEVSNNSESNNYISIICFENERIYFILWKPIRAIWFSRDILLIRNAMHLIPL